MSDQYGNDFLTVTDDDGNVHTFEVLDEIETEKGRFIAVVPVYDDLQEMLEYDGELIILEVVENEDQEELASIDDEQLFEEIFSIFEQRLEDYYEIKVEEEN